VMSRRTSSATMRSARSSTRARQPKGTGTIPTATRASTR
jgi:hypothetical protein